MLDNIRVAIGTFFDIWDFVTLITGGGGGVVGWLYQIPVWAIVLLFGLLVFGIIRVVIKYRKWRNIRGQRSEWLDIPSILEQMYNRLCEMAKELVDNGVVDNKKLAKAYSQFIQALMVDKRLGHKLLYRYGSGSLTGKPLRLWNRLLYKKSRGKDLHEGMLLMTFALTKVGIGLKTDDGHYSSLKTKLDDLAKTMDNESIDSDIHDYLELSYQVCSAQLINKYLLGGVEGMGILLERANSKAHKAMSQDLFKLRKKIVKYWLDEG